MPTYVYRCPKCGVQAEMQHSMSESYESAPCDTRTPTGHNDYIECTGTLRKVFFPTSAILRGSGWGKDA